MVSKAVMCGLWAATAGVQSKGKEGAIAESPMTMRRQTS